MIYEILDNVGNVVNTIVADESFVEKNYPGKYRLVGPEPPASLIVPVLSKVALISRFTPEEYVGIVGATKTDVEVQAWYDLFQASTKVNLEDPRTVAGINAFVPKGLLTQARATTILTDPVQQNEIPS